MIRFCALICIAASTYGFASTAQEGESIAQASSDAWIGDFRRTVSQCWNVPTDAEETVVISFQLNRDGKVDGDVTLIDPEDPNASHLEMFNAGKRAVLRCQGVDGYNLPADQYEVWQDVVLTFNPSASAGTRQRPAEFSGDGAQAVTRPTARPAGTNSGLEADQ